MAERELSYVEFKAERAAKEAEWTQRDEVKAAIDYGASALSGANTRDIADIRALLDEVLLPALVEGSLQDYHEELGDTSDWDYIAVRNALEGTYTGERSVVAAFRSCVAVAEAEDIVGDVRNYAAAYGYERRLGRLWSPYEMNVGDEVQLVTRVSGHPKTLFCGSTGQGKSATLDAEVADRYAAGYKIIDLVDTDEFESALYDIPQQQDGLRQARAELDLPPSAAEADYGTPDVEVLVPTTRGTANLDIPARNDGDSVVRPFSIPASTLDETTIVSFLTAMVSNQQESSIRTAFGEVNEDGDWTLADLANRIAERDDLRESFQSRSLRLLEDLQRKGFVRDKDAEHAIDWERIFADENTITAFSVAPLESQIDQMMVMSYLVRALYDKRRDLTDLPPACGVLRELHEVVPHRNETAADRRAEALQEALAANLSYILRKNRHERLEILADTQDVMDLKKGVRKRFSRFVAFKMPDSSLQSAFEYAGESNWQSCRDAIPFDRGVGAVIGATEPNVTRDLAFLAPVEFAPAPFHHFDVDAHDSGLEARTTYLNEELQPAPWSGAIPERLRFSREEDVDSPMEIFVEDCLRVAPDASADAQAVLDAYNTFAEERGYDDVANTKWLTRKLNGALGIDVKARDGEYQGFTLTTQAEHYIPNHEPRDDAQVTSD